MLIISRVSGQLLFPQSILLFFFGEILLWRGGTAPCTIPRTEWASVLAPFSGVLVWMQDSGSIS